MVEIGRRERIIIIIIAAAFLFGGGFKLAQLKNNQKEPPSLAKSQLEETSTKNLEELSKDIEGIEAEPEINREEGNIFVHVTGAVAKPGLYELPLDCRVNDALQKADPLPEADLNSLNLAEKLADGQKVQVMVKGSGQDTGSTGAAQQNKAGQGAGTAGGKVNINTAGVAEFDSLPGIGPSLAQRIMDYRKTHGFFKSVTELRQVSGIGEKKFAELRAYVSN